MADARAAAGRPPWPAAMAGHLVICSLREKIAIPHDELTRAWGHFGLPGLNLPKRRAPVDAFRKATPKQAKDRFSFMPYKGAAKESGDMLAAVVVVASDDEIGRVDKRHRTLGILGLYDDGSSGEIRYDSDYVIDPAVRAFTRQIEVDYDRYLNHVDGSQVRHLIHRTLREVSALTYHNGVSLIPRVHGDVADRLAEFIRFLSSYAPTPNDVYVIPYLETETTRQDAKQILRSHIETEAGRILQAAQDFISGGGDPRKRGPNTSQTLLTDLASLDVLLRDYEQTLAEVQIELGVYLGAKKQLVKQILTI